MHVFARFTGIVVIALGIMMIACTDHVVAPSPDLPIAASYPSVGSTFSIQPATATDSRVPDLTALGDSAVVTMVVPTICGRDTVMAGAAHDSLVITLRRTSLPLPCAILLPDVRLRAAAIAKPRPRFVVVTVQRLDFTDTTRALALSAVLSRE
jgi:hypothetical protein